MITTKLQGKSKKENIIVNEEIITKSIAEDFNNQNIEIIDLKKVLGLESDNLKKAKISRSESCI